jgi:hypothetical protein
VGDEPLFSEQRDASVAVTNDEMDLALLACLQDA